MTVSKFEGTFELSDFEHDPVTLVAHEILMTVARWPQDRRDEAHETLGGLALICATSSQHPDHRGTAELLTLLRRLIRAIETRWEVPDGD